MKVLEFIGSATAAAAWTVLFIYLTIALFAAAALGIIIIL